jgi:hypothetical protein
MPIVWEKEPEQAFVELADAYATAIHRGVFAICQRWAPEIENYMKQTAPWTDRTGNLRQALYTEVNEVVNTMVELILSHGLDYGIFLETRNSGRFSVIGPALDHFAVKVWADVKRMLGQ